MKPLVSMIVPCYNVEKKIVNLMESILKQSYTNIETIFVDDGSIDNTKEVIHSYKEKIEALGMKFLYIRQENSGAAGAIRTGLDYVNGKYLIWPDADDALTEKSVEMRVDFLETHPEYEWVRSNAYVINSVNPNDRTKLIVSHKNIKRHWVYNECIRFKTFYCPGCYMIKWEDFLKANPEKYIYQTYYGQNIQMLLPMAYNYKCGYIDVPLYEYIIYDDSHSRLGGDRTYIKKINYLCNVEKIMIETMKSLGIENRNDYKKVQNDFCVRRLRIAYNSHNQEDKKKEYNKIKGILKFNPIIILMKITKKNKLVDIMDKLYQLCDIGLFKLQNRS